MTEISHLSLFKWEQQKDKTDDSENDVLVYDIQVEQFFKTHKVAKWQIIPAFTMGNSEIPPVIVIEWVR